MPKRKRWKRIFLGALAAFVLIAIIDQAWVQWNRRITISEKTTRITAPLSNGYPDYLAALNAKLSEGVTPENNAAPILMEIIDTSDMTEAWNQAVYGTLKLPIPANRKGRLETFVHWAAKQADSSSTREQPSDNPFAQSKEETRLQTEFDETRQKPWTAADYPEMARYLNAQTNGLAAVERACEHSRFYIPLATPEGLTAAGGQRAVLFTGLVRLGNFRESALLLNSRAMLRLGAGDFNGFRDDLIRSLRLGRLLDQWPHPLCHLVAIAIDRITFEAIQRVTATRNLSAAQAEELIRAVIAVQRLPSPAVTWDLYQRYETLDSICSAKEMGFGRAFDEAVPKASLYVVPFKFDECLKKANEYCDRYAAALDLPRFQDRNAAITNISHDLELIENAGVMFRFTHPSDVFLLEAIPSFGRLHVLHTNGEQERILALTALSLLIHRAQTGSYPEQLGDLKTPEAAWDLFAEKPLTYRRNEKGYILYSVGSNLKDEQGKRRETRDAPDDQSVIAEN